MEIFGIERVRDRFRVSRGLALETAISYRSAKEMAARLFPFESTLTHRFTLNVLHRKSRKPPPENKPVT
jgi:hypothetical protein